MKTEVIPNVPEAAAPPRLSPTDFCAFLPWACKQLMAPFQVIVIQEDVKKGDEKPSKPVKSKTRLNTQPASAQTYDDSEELSNEFTVILTAVYDGNNLIEIILARYRQVPQLLLKLISLAIPYHRLLQKFTTRWCQLQGDVFCELSKFLPLSAITEVCLDDSISYEANYEILLKTPQLRVLSLARCRIGDLVCGNIVSELEYPKPASKGLVALNLSSNALSDASCEGIGAALRGNRQLRYLNLSGNWLTDDGAAHIFRSLMEFPLTYDEIMAKRMQRIEYLKTWRQKYEICLQQLGEAANKNPEETSKKVTSPKSKDKEKTSTGVDSNIAKAEAMTNELLGSFNHPYRDEETVCKDGYVHCIGNMALCSLNMAYNNLEYPSVAKLHEVLEYQRKLVARGQTGLMRVTFEGNDMPVSCRKLDQARQCLDQVLETWSKVGKNNKQPSKK